jgi:hypothetical protein
MPRVAVIGRRSIALRRLLSRQGFTYRNRLQQTIPLSIPAEIELQICISFSDFLDGFGGRYSTYDELGTSTIQLISSKRVSKCCAH